MRHFLAAMAVAALAGTASAQYKTPAPGTPQGTPAVPVSPNPNVQITPVSPVDHSMDAARRITREEAQKMIAQKKAVYVDVRAKDQYDIEHIKGALNIPLGELPTHLKDLPKKKFLITYCA